MMRLEHPMIVVSNSSDSGNGMEVESSSSMKENSRSHSTHHHHHNNNSGTHNSGNEIRIDSSTSAFRIVGSPMRERAISVSTTMPHNATTPTKTKIKAHAQTNALSIDANSGTAADHGSGNTVNIGSPSHMTLRKNPKDFASPFASPRRARTSGSSSKSRSCSEFEYLLDATSPHNNTIHNTDSQSTQSYRSTTTPLSVIGGPTYVGIPGARPSSDYRGTSSGTHNPGANPGNRTSTSVGSRSSTASHKSLAKKLRSASFSRRGRSDSSGSHPGNPGSASDLSPNQEEQVLFEQRLTQNEFGVTIRKIHSNGKSQLRHVRCVLVRNSSIKKKHRMRHSASRSVPAGSGGQALASGGGGRSVSSLIGRISRRSSSKGSVTAATTDLSRSPSVDDSMHINSGNNDVTSKYTKALTWGTKKKIHIPLYKFIAVRKGKTTDRTKRNAAPPNRTLSLVTSDKRNSSLDIEAPTKLDRDKFAKAFSVFLKVPLEEDLVGESVNVNAREPRGGGGGMEDKPTGWELTAVESEVSSMRSGSTCSTATFATPSGALGADIGGHNHGRLLPEMTPSPSSSKGDTSFPLQTEDFDGLKGIMDSALEGKDGDLKCLSKAASDDLLFPDLGSKKTRQNRDKGDGGDMMANGTGTGERTKKPRTTDTFDLQGMESNKPSNTSNTNTKPNNNRNEDAPDSKSDISSLTQGFNQELVEELHCALNELRAELESSRAEAARAVKVAEQAIQSAESCSSNDWNSTVTHKAAEAAAQAQKRSAEAIAKQRSAEERLAGEKKSAGFWKGQARGAEEEVGGLRIRLAGMEVQRLAVQEELERQKVKTGKYIQVLKRDFKEKEGIQRDTMVSVAEQNRLLEIELDGTRRDLDVKGEETKALQDSIMEIREEGTDSNRAPNKKKFFGNRSKRSRNTPGALLHDCPSRSTSSSALLTHHSNHHDLTTPRQSDHLKSDELLNLQAEAAATRKQFDLVRRTTLDELRQLPEQATEWANLAANALKASQVEVTELKGRLSMEVSNRRKLMGEVHDLRGTVRVYCRPSLVRSKNGAAGLGYGGIISVPSNDLALLHRERVVVDGGGGSIPCSGVPMSFEFDRMFKPSTSQGDLYAEVEELVLGALDGYNACFMAYGQTGTGKTRTLIGDFKVDIGEGRDATPQVHLLESGVHLLAAQQLFRVAENQRKECQISFTLSILEVSNEKLVDMAVDAKNSGRDWTSDAFDEMIQPGDVNSKQPKKMEIRTNHDGDTIVQGLKAIEVHNIGDVIQVWKDSLAARAKRLKSKGQDVKSHEASSHVIVTIEVHSKHLNSKIGTIGKIQFVDLAGSDVVPRRGSSSNKSKPTMTDDILAPVVNNQECKFVNKSIAHLLDVINARHQFSRVVPYRHSTLTHLLRDSLTADTRVLLLLCVSSDSKDLQDTANSMRFGSKMRKVVIGKATKHFVSIP